MTGVQTCALPISVRADGFREIIQIAFLDFRAEMQVLQHADFIYVHGVRIIFAAEQEGFERRIVNYHISIFSVFDISPRRLKTHGQNGNEVVSVRLRLL